MPFLVHLLALLPPAVAPQERPLWGDLEPGPHGVGFQAWWERDASRDYNTVFADGSRFSEAPAPRPIRIHLWYPAAPSEDRGPSEPMPHGGYLELASDDPSLARLGVELSAYYRQVLMDWMIASPAATPTAWDHSELERILAQPTACLPAAPAAAGAFPLVLYHTGYNSSFEDNAVLCEYLASHGYVVAGSTFLNELGESFNVDGKEGSARDLAFLLGRLAGDPRVDARRVAVAGHSGGAHAALRFQAQPQAALDAVIALDTTQDYVSALDPHWGFPARMLANVPHQTAPILAVAQPHAFFQVLDALVYAERTYLTFRDLEHNDTTSQGIQTAEIAARRARGSPGAEALAARARLLRRGYERCCTYIRLFLDAHLKRDASARERLDTLYRSTPLGGDEPHAERVDVGVADPLPYDPAGDEPPTPRQFVRLAHQGAGAAEVLERFRGTRPDAPIFEAYFAYGLLYDLVARDRRLEAEALAPILRELHPALGRFFEARIEASPGERYRGFRAHARVAADLLVGASPPAEAGGDG